MQVWFITAPFFSYEYIWQGLKMLSLFNLESWTLLFFSSWKSNTCIQIRTHLTTTWKWFRCPLKTDSQPKRTSFSPFRKNYFTSSDPHHDMLGGGCQVRVIIKNMMGRMENLRTLISGFLGLVILVRWALVTMFLSWSTQTGCRIHRTYVSLIGSGEGRHTTHFLKCVLLLSTSQTDSKQSSDVLSDISFDILSDKSSDISSDKLTYLLTFFLTSFWHIFWHSFWKIFWHSFWHIFWHSFWHIFRHAFWQIFWYIFWHSFWHIFWHSFWHLSDISFDILSDISSDILSDISFDMLSDISSDILSDTSKPKPNIHSFTKKAALQTLYLPRTTQQK